MRSTFRLWFAVALLVPTVLGAQRNAPRAPARESNGATGFDTAR
jgi:hypothetical protein